MIGLDTNVLLRHLTQDDPAQSAQATALIETRLNAGEPGFVSVVVIVEVAWALERAYRLSAGEIAEVLEALISTGVLVVEREAEVFEAMVALKRGLGSFADALIAALGRQAGCSHTATFDRKALRLAGFSPVA